MAPADADGERQQADDAGRRRDESRDPLLHAATVATEPRSRNSRSDPIRPFTQQGRRA
jgi:hypothetical protein